MRATANSELGTNPELRTPNSELASQGYNVLMHFLLTTALLLQAPPEWTRFGPGSWAETLTTGRREGTELRTVEKAVLTAFTESELILSIESVDAGGGRSSIDMNYPLPQRAPAKEEQGKKAGEEKLTIGGREYACDIVERGGVRRWVCASVAANGGVMKSEAVTGTTRILTRLVKLEEKVAVGKESLACWVREEITDTGDQKTTRTSWICDAVPGGVVKSQVRQVRGGDVVVETATILTGFLVVQKK